MALLVTAILFPTALGMAQTPPRKTTPDAAGPTAARLPAPRFADTFAANTLGDYRVQGGVAWQPARLDLAAGARLTRALKAGPTAELVVRLEFPSLVKDGDQLETRITFVPEGVESFGWNNIAAGYPISVVLFWKREGDKVGGEIRISVARTVPSGSKREGVEAGLLRRFPLEASPGKAAWTLRYRYGMLSVFREGKEVAVGYYNNYSAGLVAVALAQEAGRVACCGWSFEGQAAVPPPAFGDRLRLLAAYRADAQSTALYEQGKFREALVPAQEALRVCQAVLGPDHVYTSNCLHMLAVLYGSLGDFAHLEPLYKQSLDVTRRTQGEGHPEYALALTNLAVNYIEYGDLSTSETLLQRAVAIQRRVLGETHAGYAHCAFHLTALYISMRDYPRAEALSRQVMEVRRLTLGEGHPDYVQSLNDLASLYLRVSDHAKAEPLCREAVQRCLPDSGRPRRGAAQSLQNLADLYKQRGDYEQAEAVYRRALALLRPTLGEQHPHTRGLLNDLASTCFFRGKYQEGEEFSRQALEGTLRAHGEQHINSAIGWHNLAMLRWTQGDPVAAESYSRKALGILRRYLELVSVIQSERQQLILMEGVRNVLDVHLSLAPRAQGSGETTYEHVLAWKGAVLARQRWTRLARQSGSPELSKLFAELDSRSGELGRLALASPEPAQAKAWRQRITELTEDKERLERQLSEKTKAFRDLRAERLRTPAEVLATLPPDAALIDFLEYWKYTPPQGERKRGARPHLVVFLLRPGRPVQQFDLGEREPIENAVSAWLARGPEGRDAREPGLRLRQLLWQPLEKHLDGVRLVLLSPDGALSRLPFTALPGNRPGSYFIEERAFALVPVPRLLPELLQPRTETGAVTANLLVVGDVDFGAAPDVPAPGVTGRTAPRRGRGGAWRGFPPLPATREEIQQVGHYFQEQFPDGKVRVLRAGAATESAFRQEARRHRWLHLATHGFLAEGALYFGLTKTSQRPGGAAANQPEFDLFSRQGVAGYHPGLLCGLALAGANRPLALGQDDGILTALEVAELDLSSAELAVLSACQTALGEQAGGEGLLGLQRAFQVAGARTVVATLWQVDDAATHQLMELFYANLWRKKLGKLDALRQAQLELLRGGRWAGRESPSSWAAFVLSGDWR
jgi:CHAT domain-containing protein/Tfp pilus assembly protein PilF